MKKRVVHVVVAGEIGGAERMLVDLAANDPNHIIALMTPNPELRALFRNAGLDVEDRGASVREGPLPFLKSTFGSSDTKWLADVFRRRRASIVHLHTFASHVVGTRAAINVGSGLLRIVRTEHSARVYDDPSCWPFSRWSLERVHAVVCISEHVKRVMVKKAPAMATDSRVSVIPNGVDVDRFAPAPAPAPLPGSTNVRFLCLGRLDPRKGLDLALEALTQVPAAHLDIVGEGEARSDLEKRVRSLHLSNRVRFLGYRADVRAAITDADVILSSAREEGLGIAILEGMAMERPVVGVPVGGVLEIVREGETGWLADVRTADALARVMTRAIESGPEERMRRGREARLRVIERFSLSSMRSAYASLYARL